MGYGDTNARYGRSRAQFARASKALSLARPDPHRLNDWVGDQLQRVYMPGG